MGRSFLLSASTVTRQELQIRSERFTPGAESEEAEVSPPLPCVRVTFHGFHDDCSEGERLDAGQIGNFTYSLLELVRRWTRQRIGGRERTAFLNSPLRRESGRIAFAFGLINVDFFRIQVNVKRTAFSLCNSKVWSLILEWIRMWQSVYSLLIN